MVTKSGQNKTFYFGSRKIDILVVQIIFDNIIIRDYVDDIDLCSEM